MDASPQYILSRAAFFIALLVAVLFGISFVKKKQREAVIIAELQAITSDSSFFHQFYPEAARKSLVRAVGLIAEATTLGVPPLTAINRSMGIKEGFFDNPARHEEPPPREKIIRECLLANYDNFLKLGYKADHQTLDAMKEGELPPIPSGSPQTGKNTVIANLIDPTLAPGMDKVIANLENRPPQAADHLPTTLEITSAKRLATNLSDGQFIEESVRDKILKALTPAEPVTPKPKVPEPVTPEPTPPTPAAPEPAAPTPAAPEPVTPKP